MKLSDLIETAKKTVLTHEELEKMSKRISDFDQKCIREAKERFPDDEFLERRYTV